MVQNDMWLSVSFLPGCLNLDVDLASWQLNPATEFELPDSVFK